MGGRDGLTLIEVIVAMLVLTVGLLGLAGGTGWAVRNAELARIETNRSAAVQSAVEGIRAIPYDQVAAGEEVYGDYSVSWSTTATGQTWKLMEIVVVGPGRVTEGGGAVAVEVADTVEYRLVQP